MKTTEHLTLKWGTLKSWHFVSDRAKELLKEYHEAGASSSAMLQHDTPRQKEIICELIEIGDFGSVYLDWDGKEVAKEQAKEYVRNYGKKA